MEDQVFKNIKVTKLLWTGGWDSTFRLIQLVVEQNCIVQPIYILDTARPSTITEITTIDKIKSLMIELFPVAKDKILPTRYFSINDIKVNKNISDKWRELRLKSHIGSQYDWLSRFAHQHHINALELSIHIDDKAYSFIKDHIVLDKSSAYILNPIVEDTDPLSLFKPFSFPLLDWTKLQMKDHAINIGAFDIMNATWFCYRPVDGKPCGLCNPCRYTIEEGLKFRFSRKALLRNRFLRYYRILSIIKQKFR